MAYPSKFVEFFGPSTWKALHSIAHTYGSKGTDPTPEEEKAILDLFGSLAVLLPCEYCRAHYAKYLHRHPIDPSDRESVPKWVYDLHSSVNKRNNMPNLSYAEVKDMYEGWNEEKSRRLMHLGPEKRVRSLADPHFGRHPPMVAAAAGKRESMEGERFGKAGIAASVVIGLAALGGVFLIKNRNRTREE
jgi:hypothetical protein